jgi:UTP-glucose-1-phosphate uridylyltransferase
MRWTRPRGGHRADDLRHRARQGAIEDYFDQAFEVEAELKAKGKEPCSRRSRAAG